MNLKRQVKLAIIFALTSQDNFIQQSQQARIAEKDFSMSGFFSKMSNLESIALDKREQNAEQINSQPQNMEMVQLSGFDPRISLNQRDVNDIMVASSMQVVGRDAPGEDSSSSAQPADQPAPEDDDMMTITEQMEHVKKQTSQTLKQMKVDEQNEKKRQATEKKQEQERKKQEEVAKKKSEKAKKKTDDQEMDEFVELQLKKQKADRETYDREILNTKTPDSDFVEPKQDVETSVKSIMSWSKKPEGDDDEASSDEKTAENNKGFKNADEALEHAGEAVAQRTVEGQLKKDEEKKEEKAKKIREENAAQLAKEKEIREEKERKKKEDQAIQDELNKKEEARRERLLSKLNSLQSNYDS